MGRKYSREERIIDYVQNKKGGIPGMEQLKQRET